MFEGHVTPFDALGFDPALATTDMLYDVAFLFMDLRPRGVSPFANVALNRYCDVSAQSEEALALLLFFMGLRAAVRIAVAVERGDLPEAVTYRDLGLRLSNPPSPRLAAIGRLSGTEKSTLARLVAPELDGACGGRLLSADRIRKAMAGVDPSTRLDRLFYTDEARAEVYRCLVERTSHALKAGSTLVAEATFRERWARDEIGAAAESRDFLGLWLTAPTAIRADRVSSRSCDVSDATSAVAVAQVEPWTLVPFGAGSTSVPRSFSSHPRPCAYCGQNRSGVQKAAPRAHLPHRGPPSQTYRMPRLRSLIERLRQIKVPVPQTF